MLIFQNNNFSNGKKPSNNNDSNPFDDHDEEWDDNSENVLTDNGKYFQNLLNLRLIFHL